MCRKEAGKREKEKARRTRGRAKRGGEAPDFSSSHRPPRGYFFLTLTQRKPLRREREGEREGERERGRENISTVTQV